MAFFLFFLFTTRTVVCLCLTKSASPPRGFWSLVSPALAEKVVAAYAPDFQLFGYDAREYLEGIRRDLGKESLAREACCNL